MCPLLRLLCPLWRKLYPLYLSLILKQLILRALSWLSLLPLLFLLRPLSWLLYLTVAAWLVLACPPSMCRFHIPGDARGLHCAAACPCDPSNAQAETDRRSRGAGADSVVRVLLLYEEGCRADYSRHLQALQNLLLHERNRFLGTAEAVRSVYFEARDMSGQEALHEQVAFQTNKTHYIQSELHPT